MAGSVLPFVLLLSLPLLAFAFDSNVLLTGESIPTDSQLIYKDVAFIIQDDCNLVLYNPVNGFQSNTQGRNCTVTLDNRGRLVIKSHLGAPVWTSPTRPNTRPGIYAAVLGPDGHVSVYGPDIWSTQPRRASLIRMMAEQSEASAGLIPAVRNVLFSSQILYNSAMLRTRDYSLVMREDCNLALEKAGRGATWETKTAGMGSHCFVRVNHMGQLTVVDDSYKVVWESNAGGLEAGDYVLVLESHGRAAVYGPKVWTTRGEGQVQG